MKEINLFGVYVAPFSLYLLIALLIFIPVRWQLDRWKVERWFWHRNLFDFSVFLIILCLVGLVL